MSQKRSPDFATQSKHFCFGTIKCKKKSSKNKTLCHETDWISLILLVEWGVQSNYQCPPNGDQTD